VFSQDHTFAGNPLDRAEYIRRDEEAIQELIKSKEGKYLVFDRLKVHVDEEGQLKWLNPTDLPSLTHQPALLGIDERSSSQDGKKDNFRRGCQPGSAISSIESGRKWR